MPTTLILLALSWLTAIFGTAGGTFFMIYNANNIGIFLRGFFIFFFSLVLAAAIRMFANIGQIIFDLDLKDKINQISAEAKEINLNISKIKTFFEQIERHLNLKNNAHGSG